MARSFKLRYFGKKKWNTTHSSRDSIVLWRGIFRLLSFPFYNIYIHWICTWLKCNFIVVMLRFFSWLLVLAYEYWEMSHPKKKWELGQWRCEFNTYHRCFLSPTRLQLETVRYASTLLIQLWDWIEENWMLFSTFLDSFLCKFSSPPAVCCGGWFFSFSKFDNRNIILFTDMYIDTKYQQQWVDSRIVHIVSEPQKKLSRDIELLFWSVCVEF